MNRNAAGTAEFEPYLKGTKLYGDDFEGAQLREWYDDEQEAYVLLRTRSSREPRYLSHAKNVRYGYRLLPAERFRNVLGFGGADGQEFLPILSRIERLTIVEPSDAYSSSTIGKVPVTYTKPEADGTLLLPDDAFDLATCFGVLHHVAKVGRVVEELFRCLRPSGFLLVEEPTISMGDWRNPRPGLTRRERGIPLQLFRQIVYSAHFEIVSERRILFAATTKLGSLLGTNLHGSDAALRLDELLCALFGWNVKYHPETFLDWLLPTNVFYVLHKPSL